MARKTIASLEEKLMERDNLISSFEIKIKEQQEEFQKLKNENELLKEQINNLESVQKLKVKNERGAGRKPIADNLVRYIKDLSEKGHSIRYISDASGVSVGAVHNILKSSLINK